MPFTYKEIPQGESEEGKSRRENREMRVRADYEDMINAALDAIPMLQLTDFETVIIDLQKILANAEGDAANFNSKLKDSIETVYEYYIRPEDYAEPACHTEYQQIIKDRIQAKINEFKSFTEAQKNQYTADQKAGRVQAVQDQAKITAAESRRPDIKGVMTDEEMLQAIQRDFDLELINGWGISENDLDSVTPAIRRLLPIYPQNVRQLLNEAHIPITDLLSGLLRAENPRLILFRSEKIIALVNEAHISFSAIVALPDSMISELCIDSRYIIKFINELNVSFSDFTSLDERHIKTMCSYYDEISNLPRLGVHIPFVKLATYSIPELRILINASNAGLGGFLLRNNISNEALFNSPPKIVTFMLDKFLTILQSPNPSKVNDEKIVKMMKDDITAYAKEPIESLIKKDSDGTLQSEIRQCWKQSRRANVTSGFFCREQSDAELTYRKIQKIFKEQPPSHDRALSIISLIHNFALSKNNEHQLFAGQLKNRFPLESIAPDVLAKMRMGDSEGELSSIRRESAK